MSNAEPLGLFRRFCLDEQAATAIEYGLIAALTAVAAIPAIAALGGGISETLDVVSAALDEEGGGGPPPTAPGREGGGPPGPGGK